MDALRRTLKELKPILTKVSFLKPLLVQGKYIFAIGAFAWLLGGLLPDTSHFAVTFFSSIGRIALFVGLILTFVKGEEDRFIMIYSTIISVGSFIVIIIELSAVSYLSSFESYLFLLLFGALAVNTSKYSNNQWLEEKDKDDTSFSDLISDYSHGPESPVQTDTFLQEDLPMPQKTPEPPIAAQESELPLQQAQPQTLEPPVQPTESHDQAEILPQKATPVPTEAPAQQIILQDQSQDLKPKTYDITPEPSITPVKVPAQKEITRVPTHRVNPKISNIQRAPSIGSAPSIGRAPSVSIEPKK